MTPTLIFVCGSLAGTITTGIVLLFCHFRAVERMALEHSARLADAKRRSYAEGYQDRAMMELAPKAKP